jgi:hypothetical protein
MNRAKAGCALHRFSANANPACAWMSNVKLPNDERFA